MREKNLACFNYHSPKMHVKFLTTLNEKDQPWLLKLDCFQIFQKQLFGLRSTVASITVKQCFNWHSWNFIFCYFFTNTSGHNSDNNYYSVAVLNSVMESISDLERKKESVFCCNVKKKKFEVKVGCFLRFYMRSREKRQWRWQVLYLELFQLPFGYFQLRA